MKLTLTTDSRARKDVQLGACLDDYFTAALVGVAQHSFVNNEKHNPGQEPHWSREKSRDHRECIRRHAQDLVEMVAFLRKADRDPENIKALLSEANALAWRALAWSQELHEEFGGAPPSIASRFEGKGDKPPICDVDPPAGAVIPAYHRTSKSPMNFMPGFPPAGKGPMYALPGHPTTEFPHVFNAVTRRCSCGVDV